MKLAAIDIGSNAARLLIVDAIEDSEKNIEFNKINLVRIPLRLGFDVFEKGEIGEVKSKMVINTMLAFRHLIDAYEVKHVKACATSAMRDAKNSMEIINEIKKTANLKIEIISGDTEASIVFENKIAETLDNKKNYLYIDVGGGSTELSYYNSGKPKFKKSFNIGTIRLLRKDVTPEMWFEMKEFIEKNTKSEKGIIAIGSGGNINKTFSLSRQKEGTPLTYLFLQKFLKEVSAYSIEERMDKYKIKVDRADVLPPALEIYINVMRWACTDQIYVPKIGVSDGLVHLLYNEINNIQKKSTNNPIKRNILKSAKSKIFGKAASKTIVKQQPKKQAIKKTIK